MERNTIALLVGLSLFPAADLFAQCAGGIAEGDSPADMPCQICRDGDLESLPPRTACGAERRLQCDDAGVPFRTECVLVSGSETETECIDNERFGDACPAGLRCDGGFCLLECSTTADCRDGYECQDEVCVGADPDMGVPADMDMGGPRPIDGSDSGISSADTGLEPDMSAPLPDLGAEPDADQSPGGTKDRPLSDGGCSTMRAHPTWVLLIFAALFGLRRRRGR